MKRNPLNVQSIFRKMILLVLAFVFVTSVFGFSGLEPVHAEAANPCLNGGDCKIYLPAVMSPSVATGDLAITGVEVVQTVQDPSNSVPLVAGRTTILRVYTRSTNMLQLASSVKISITASGSGLSLSDAPQTLTTAISDNSSRANYSSSVNYVLPEEWLSGSKDLTIKLDSDNQISETNESNNTITQHLEFNSVPALDIMVVPVEYHDPRTNHVYAAPSKDTVSDWISRTYPVSQINISWHAPIVFSQDLSNSSSFQTLLQQVTALKNSESKSAATVYFGLIPTDDGSTHWFNGGTAGMGWVGYRAAVGLDLSGQTSQIAAHEIGHNLGLPHANCGGASNPDPNFPYANGAIGQYGLDPVTKQVYAPSTYDMMSYCSPKWISDYNYKKLYTAQRNTSQTLTLASADPRTAQSKRQMLVRANVYSDHTDFLPVYVLPGSAANMPAAGSYEVKVLSANDEVLTQVPVDAYATSAEDAEVQGINALVPLPDQPAAKVQLLKDGVVLAEQMLQNSADQAAPEATVEAAENGYVIRWNAVDQPAMVRYSTDGGATWTTLGMDAVNGELTVPAGAYQPDGMVRVVPAGLWK